MRSKREHSRARDHDKATRLAFIDEELLWTGEITRRAIEETFGVSEETAKADLRAYRRLMPDLKPDRRDNIYRVPLDFAPRLSNPAPEVYLDRLARRGTAALPVATVPMWIGVRSTALFSRAWSAQYATSRKSKFFTVRLARRRQRDIASSRTRCSLGEIAELMETKRIKRVPVVHNGKIVGIVSRADLLQVLASGGTTTADEDSDRLIREQLLAELRKQE